MNKLNLFLGYIMIACGMTGVLIISFILVGEADAIKSMPGIAIISRSSSVQLYPLIYLGLIVIAGVSLVNGSVSKYHQ